MAHRSNAWHSSLKTRVCSLRIKGPAVMVCPGPGMPGPGGTETASPAGLVHSEFSKRDRLKRCEVEST